MLITYTFSLEISCVKCVERVKKIVNECKKNIPIHSFEVDLVEKQLTVIVEDDGRSPKEIRELFCKALGHFDAEPTSWFKKILRLHWLWGLLGVAAGLALLGLSLFLGPLPLIAMITIASTSVLLTSILGLESYERAVEDIKKRSLTMDTLFAISTLTVIAVSIGAFFVPWLPMMFDAALLIYGFRHVGIAIEKSIKRAMSLSARFKDRLPETVTKFNDDYQNETVLLEAVKPNDILLIQTGDIIPVDGVCDVDEAWIIETNITGSTQARKIHRGESLLSGMYFSHGIAALRMKVTKPVSQSYLPQLDEKIASDDSEKKAPLEVITNKILQYFIPFVLILAITAAAIISGFFPLAIAIKCAVTILVSACPCTLGFVIPLAVKIGMQKASDKDVKFKNARTLQAAEQIKIVVFDLHGTLTEGVPTVSAIEAMPESKLNARELLAYFARLENESKHPVAKAICAHAQRQGIKLAEDEAVKNINQTNHSGLTASMDDHQYTIGNQDMMDALSIKTDKIQSSVSLNGGESIIYLARDGVVIGYIKMTDPLRNDARHVIESLQSMGKQVYICTGADQKTAALYAHKLGLPLANVRGGYVGLSRDPSVVDKGNFIDELKKQGKVAMIGDGGNDALAASRSNFAIAIKSIHASEGSEVTQTQAGAVIVNSRSLLPVVHAFEVSKQTVKNIKQNLIMSLSYNVGVMVLVCGLLLAIGMTLNPGVGVLLMIVQSCLILFNAHRFKQQKLAQQPAPNLHEEAMGSSHERMQILKPSSGKTPQAEEVRKTELIQSQKTTSQGHLNCLLNIPKEISVIASCEIPTNMVKTSI